MFINSLVIRKNGEGGEPIRIIEFKKGVNLIVDESPQTKSPTATGNNIGKTTVLRLIDYCLGGKKVKIYQDPEFKGRNEKDNKIKNFLEEQKVCIHLILTLDLSSSKEIIITRNFLSRSHKIQKINGYTFINDREFAEELGKIIFCTSPEKPTFRQIICRNIRHESNSLSKTLKPLHQTTPNVAYELLYLYWLGVPHDSQKFELSTKLDFERKYYKQIEASQGALGTVKQKIYAYEKEINNLNDQKKKFNINENYTQDLNELNQVKKSINELKTSVVSLTLKKNLVIESQKELDNTAPNIEKDKIKFIYSEAQSLIPDLQKKFEDILSFHNQMIEEKKKFIGQELPNINKELKNKEKEKDKLLEQETNLTEKLEKTGAFEELEQIIVCLTEQHEAKGRLEKSKEILENSQFEINKLESKLNSIQQKLNEKKELIEEKITIFNGYFLELSNKLYKQKFLLSHNFDEKRNLVLNIDGLEENPGTGGKKGEIIAFDLAYIQFAEKLDVPHVNFVLHDQIENIHDNQINITLLDIVKNINCQYIIPILSDKVPSDINIKEYQVLTLSQDNKLFKI